MPHKPVVALVNWSLLGLINSHCAQAGGFLLALPEPACSQNPFCPANCLHGSRITSQAASFKNEIYKDQLRPGYFPNESSSTSPKVPECAESLGLHCGPVSSVPTASLLSFIGCSESPKCVLTNSLLCNREILDLT